MFSGSCLEIIPEMFSFCVTTVLWRLKYFALYALVLVASEVHPQRYLVVEGHLSPTHLQVKTRTLNSKKISLIIRY